MDTTQNQFFLNQTRSARAALLADAEGFYIVIRLLEFLGQLLTKKMDGLDSYKDEISRIADDSPLSRDVPSEAPTWHVSFRTIYDELRWARNDVIHQGAHARSITNHAIELLVVLEDALMSNASIVSQFMVRNVVEAHLWDPISYVRQQMLKHAFSHIPVRIDGHWHLIPEWMLARHLRSAPSRTKRKEYLLENVSDVIQSRKLDFPRAKTISPATAVHVAANLIEEQPVLVVDPNHDEVLLGILTSSDIL